MTLSLKTVVVAGFGLAGIALGFAGPAAAMPGQGFDTAVATSADVAMKAQDVRVICPPYRPCYRVPGYYRRPYAYYRPYPYYRPYGYGYRPFFGRRFY